jgi:hypothetical protein
VLCISRCRALLGSVGDLSDEEIRNVRDAFYAVANAAVDALLAQAGEDRAENAGGAGEQGRLAMKGAAPRREVVEQAAMVVTPAAPELAVKQALSPVTEGERASRRGGRRTILNLVPSSPCPPAARKQRRPRRAVGLEESPRGPSLRRRSATPVPTPPAPGAP